MTWHICRLGNPYKLTFILPRLYPGWGSRSKRSIFARLREVKSLFLFQPATYNLSDTGVMELLRKTNIFLPKMMLKMIFLFQKMGYVSSLLVGIWKLGCLVFSTRETLKSYKCIGRYLIYDFHTGGWIDSRNLQLTLPGTKPLKISRS